MPVFGSGHAHVRFEQSLKAMRDVLSSADTGVEHVTVVVYDPDRADDARAILAS